MIGGLATKLSEESIVTATTIQVRADLVKLVGTTTIDTINAQFGGGFSGIVIFVPTTGAVTLATTGNIAAVATCAQDRATVLIYSKATEKFYPGAVS